MSKGTAAWVLCASILAGGCATVPLQPGEAMQRSKCGACHLAPSPERFDRSGWERVLEQHRERVPLTEEERAALLAYLAPTPDGQDPADK